jgi:hypothetical protein
VANRAGRPSRGLDEVLHYFIDEDEQRDARAEVQAEPAGRVSAPWCLVVQPARPLATWLVLELAEALAKNGASAMPLCGFDPHPLVEDAARSRWRRIADGPADGLAKRLCSELDATTPVLVALAAEDLTALLPALAPGRIAGLILPVDASSRGLSQALGLLRALPRSVSGLRIAVLCLGSTEGEGPAVFRKLDGAARRQLGIRLESLGELRRASPDFRALLRGGSVLRDDPEAPSARALLRVRERLGRPAQATNA